MGARDGRYKLGAKAGRYKLAPRASKYVLGPRARGPGDTKTLYDLKIIEEDKKDERNKS